MEDNATRHALRAAAGLSKAIRQDYVPPDTRILGPDGTLRLLGRRAESLDPVIAFRKSNPARRNARSGKRPPRGRGAALGGAAFGRGVKADGFGGGPLGGFLRGPMELLGRIPLMNILVTAALAHRAWSLVTRRLLGRDDETSASSSAAAAQRGGDWQLARRDGVYDDDYDEDDEYDINEHAEELLSQMQQASMLPAMLRSSLPRPHRTGLAKRAAQQYHSRPRSYRTSHQMLHGGPAAATGNGGLGAGGNGGGGGAGRPGQEAGRTGRRQAQRRPLGKLETMDLVVRQQIRAAMLAQQQQQEQPELAALEAGPSGSGDAATSTDTAWQQQSQQQGLLQQHSDHAWPTPTGQLVLAPTSAPSGSRGPYPPPHRLLMHPGPPPPPAFRPLPPELRARLQGMRQPGAVAMATAARAVAAGPPLLGEQEEIARKTSHAGAGSVAVRPGLGGSGTDESTGGEVPGRAEGHGQVDVAAGNDGPAGTHPGGLEGEKAKGRFMALRVARGARNVARQEDGG